jgi:hypothetical protein
MCDRRGIATLHTFTAELCWSELSIAEALRFERKLLALPSNGIAFSTMERNVMWI